MPVIISQKGHCGADGPVGLVGLNSRCIYTGAYYLLRFLALSAGIGGGGIAVVETGAAWIGAAGSRAG